MQGEEKRRENPGALTAVTHYSRYRSPDHTWPYEARTRHQAFTFLGQCQAPDLQQATLLPRRPLFASSSNDVKHPGAPLHQYQSRKSLDEHFSTSHTSQTLQVLRILAPRLSVDVSSYRLFPPFTIIRIHPTIDTNPSLLLLACPRRLASLLRIHELIGPPQTKTVYKNSNTICRMRHKVFARLG